eukprot:GHVL01044861.1.p2 GENE.GHVL01044861.1~~GHVL01044861.1.p2  ORF type:complete len:483 (-),score=52.97 GHVL01044861.1:2041-3489(-)
MYNKNPPPPPPSRSSSVIGYDDEKKSDDNLKAEGMTAAAAAVASRPLKAHIPRPHSDWDIPDRYEIRHLIGTGSYGHVCEAYNREIGRVVAIKRIHRVFEDLVDCKRILREIAILNRLNHPHVVNILDICVPPDLEKFDELYVVLEIADSDFKKLFRTPVFLSELHIKTLLYNLLIGVKYLHSKGIYHRDLKPANCLVNQDCSVKICDFGLARPAAVPVFIAPELPTSPRNGLSSEEETRNSHNGQDSDVLGGVVPHTKTLKKQLTGHVVTRWYRAPELILLEENYTHAIDIWSVGCIFAELLNMMKENIQFHSDRGPLFPGSSCFPLSPDQKHPTDYKFHTRGNRDQLHVIFNILGTPKDEDVEVLQKDDAKRYIRIFNSREPIDIATKFPGTSEVALNLLKKMLVFNPQKRISVDDALAHELFRDIRNIQLEKASVGDGSVILPFEDRGQAMSEEQLRLCFLNEIRQFHTNLKIPKFEDP